MSAYWLMPAVFSVIRKRCNNARVNRFSKEKDYELARKDIEKALELKPDEQIYKEHKQILEKIIQEKKEAQLESVRKLIEKVKRKKEKVKELNSQNMDVSTKLILLQNHQLKDSLFDHLQ